MGFQLREELTEGRSAPFLAAVSWYRLLDAELAVHGAVGIDHPLVREIAGLRSTVHLAVYEQVPDKAKRDEVFAQAKAYVKGASGSPRPSSC